jgi:valyl-tRNA synthetase
MQGRKMSKSLGNSPDPLDLIAKYGADGLRFGTMSCAAQGQDILFSEERVELGRNFCNKLWNACRFRQMSGTSQDNSSLENILKRIDVSKLDSDDKAIITSLIECSRDVAKDYDEYQFNAITNRLYSFFWSDFCDWYLEVSKARLADESAKETVLAVQDLCIRGLLLMLHPFTPFITEELWHSMGFGGEESFIQNESLCFVETLESFGISADTDAMKQTENLRDFATKARALKAQYKLANKRDVKLYFTADAENTTLIAANSEKLIKLIGAASLEAKPEDGEYPVSLTELGAVYIDLSDSVDVEAEKKRLGKEKEKLEGLVKSTEARLSNEAFVSKAPPQVIEGAKKQLDDYRAKIAEVEKLLANL